MTVLVVTNRDDVHADHLIRKADSHFQVFRWNTEVTSIETDVEFAIDTSGKAFGTLDCAPFRSTALTDIKSVWYRKPVYDFQVPVSNHNREFVRSETRSAIDGVFTLLNSALWVNDPFVANRSRVKAQQLVVAALAGFRVPRTLVTANLAHAAQFVKSCEHGAVAKTVYAATAMLDGLPQAMPTQIVKVDDLLSLDGDVARCPVQFQERIRRKYDLRVTVVGGEVFAVKIESDLLNETTVDWRPFTELCRHSVFELSLNLSNLCRNFVSSQGLAFGALDLIVAEGDLVFFLENNPFGQYLWLEQETGLPITDAIISLLNR